MANERASLYLQPETNQALKSYAERKGLTISAAADELLRQGLSEVAAEQVGEMALPAIEETTRRAIAAEMRTALHALREELAAIHLETAMGRLETYALLAHDYGFEVADRAERAAQEFAEAARGRGDIARMAGVVRHG